jgi:predicted nuclease of predicted toxin-antitoxin system
VKLLLDQGLPRTTVPAFQFGAFQSNAFQVLDSRVEAKHVGDIGLASAADEAILAYARDHGLTVVTLDADFHARLALNGARGPSVIRIRIEGLKAQQLADLLVRVIEQCQEDLNAGAMVTVTGSGVRVRRLPLPRL